MDIVQATYQELLGNLKTEDKSSIEEDWVLLPVHWATVLGEADHCSNLHLDSNLDSLIAAAKPSRWLGIAGQAIRPFTGEWAFVGSKAVAAQVRIATGFEKFSFDRLPVFHLCFLIKLAGTLASCPSLASLSSRMDCFPKNFDLDLEIGKCFGNLIEHRLLFFFILPLPALKVSAFPALLTISSIFPILAKAFLLFLFKVMQLFIQLLFSFSKLQHQQLSLLNLLFSIFLPWFSTLLLFAVD